MKKVALLGIDIQNDFTCPDGSLYVQGAVDDVKRISEFINRAGDRISYIALSLDSHQPVHIAHQIYWKDKDGNMPELFSEVLSEDIVADKWIPQYNQDKAFYYLVKLEEEGMKCTIWPPHCIQGTAGWTIDKLLSDCLYSWNEETGHIYELFMKGTTQYTEHYSIFEAAVPFRNAEETQLNTLLLDKLNCFDELILVGEAADFCVANSLNHIVLYYPELAEKTVVFTDCMSWITEGNVRANEIFSLATKYGTKFIKSTGYK